MKNFRQHLARELRETPYPVDWIDRVLERSDIPTSNGGLYRYLCAECADSTDYGFIKNAWHRFARNEKPTGM